MLFASKRELHAGVALSILQVREQELAYYTANISNIGLQASLLAGFAFATLSSHDSEDVLTWIDQPMDAPFIIISFNITPAQQIRVLLELLYLTSTISAMGSTLYTLYICLITSILGPGLALRGPEGSVDRAVIGLARVNRKVIQSFGFALDLFQFSILVTTFLNFHLIAACVCSFFVCYYMVRIKRYTSKLTKEFLISKELIVTGRFEDEGQGRAISAAEQHLFPTFVDTLHDKLAQLGRRLVQLGRWLCGKRADVEAAPRKPTEEFPSYVASNMMHHWQGPLPEEFDGELAAEEVAVTESMWARWHSYLFGADAAKPPDLPPALRQHPTATAPVPSPAPSERRASAPARVRASPAGDAAPRPRPLRIAMTEADLSVAAGDAPSAPANAPPLRIAKSSDVVSRRDLSVRSYVSDGSVGPGGAHFARARTVSEFASRRVEI